jgi:predicted DNA-binding protein (MmcQ/YjbR family)
VSTAANSDGPAGGALVRERLTTICLGLPEATFLEWDLHRTFKVRTRTFAYYLDDHHGDGRVAVCCKAPPGEAEALVSTDPERFYRPDYLWTKGWVSLRLDLDDHPVDWQEVAELVTESYRLVAPKRLAALATPPAPSTSR